MIPSKNQPIPPRVDFDWSPKSVAVDITVAGNDYPYTTQADSVVRDSDTRYAAYTTATNQELTFTASVSTFDSFVLRYHWSMGDGTEAFGPEVQKTYIVPNPTVSVTLAVLDSNGLETRVHKNLNLVYAAVPSVRPVIRVNP